MAKEKDKAQTTGLGERVRKRRKALGMTAKALARAAGVSTSYISQVERGHQLDPSLPALRRLADALSMDLHVLMGAQPTTAQRLEAPTALQELAREYALSAETMTMLAAIHLDGRQPATREDWLFLLLAIRRACRMLEPLSLAQPAEKGEKHAVNA